MTKWEYIELKITHNEVELVDGDLRPTGKKISNPFHYVERMIEDGWELVGQSGSLDDEFSVVLKRTILEN